MPTGSVSEEASLLGWQVLCPYMVFSLSACTPGVSFSNDTSHIGLGVFLMTSFNLIYLLKDLISKYYQLRISALTYEFWVHNSR